MDKALNALHSWPPESLDEEKYHIIVEFGSPLTVRQRCIKLAIFLNRTLSCDKNAWSYYLPMSTRHGICGALFSTDKQMAYEKELQVVYEIKYGSDDFESESNRCPFGDDNAYTNLTLLEPNILPTSSVITCSDSGSDHDTHFGEAPSP